MTSLNFKKILAISFALMFFILILPSAAIAQTGNPPAPVSFPIRIPNPLNIDEEGGIPALLEKIISEAILPIGAVVVVIMIIYAGFLYVTASGNETKVKTAHTALLYAIIGAAILLGARVLAGAITTTITQIGG
jgi:hypothetical protein